MNIFSSNGLMLPSNSFNTNSHASGRLLSGNISQIIENSKSKFNQATNENELNKNYSTDQSISNFK